MFNQKILRMRRTQTMDNRMLGLFETLDWLQTVVTNPGWEALHHTIILSLDQRRAARSGESSMNLLWLRITAPATSILRAFARQRIWDLHPRISEMKIRVPKRPKKILASKIKLQDLSACFKMMHRSLSPTEITSNILMKLKKMPVELFLIFALQIY